MPLSPFAGKPAPPELLIDVGALLRAYHERAPDPNDPQQRVLRHERPPRQRRERHV